MVCSGVWMRTEVEVKGGEFKGAAPDYLRLIISYIEFVTLQKWSLVPGLHSKF